jgi:hypothetical protein
MNEVKQRLLLNRSVTVETQSHDKHMKLQRMLDCCGLGLLTRRSTRKEDSTKAGDGQRLGSTRCRRRRGHARTLKIREIEVKGGKKDINTHCASNLLTTLHLSPTMNDVNRDNCTKAAMMDTMATWKCSETKGRHQLREDCTSSEAQAPTTSTA